MAETIVIVGIMAIPPYGCRFTVNCGSSARLAPRPAEQGSQNTVNARGRLDRGCICKQPVEIIEGGQVLGKNQHPGE
jgi:hypothetical protein